MCQNKFECFLVEMHDKINNMFVLTIRLSNNFELEVALLQ